MEPMVNNALVVAQPLHGKNWHFAHATTAVTYFVPPTWRGKWITIASSAADLFLTFGDAGADLKSSGVSAAIAVGASEPKYAVPAWNAGEVVLAGTYRDFYVEESATYWCVVSSAASGNYYISVTSRAATEQAPPVGDMRPAMWLDVSAYPTLAFNSTDVTSIRCRVANYLFSEPTNMPAYVAGSAETMLNARPTASFTAASSDKLVSTDAGACALLGGTSAYTLVIGCTRGATGAAHTLFSGGTTGSNNGRFDITFDASDDVAITRVSSAGASTTSTYTTTVAGAPTTHLLTYAYDGNGGNTLYFDRTAVSLTGSAAGDLGTLTKLSVGCRGYNTSTFDQHYTGKVGFALLYPRVLNATEVAKLHGEWAVYQVGV